MICHGAGSAKESHFDFARGCRADGIAALAFDARGHGRSEGAFGASAFDDVLAMVGLMREHAPRVALRGSSMGGFCAIHAAALDPDVAAVVAICPAPEDILLRGLRSGELRDFEVDRDGLEPLLESSSLYDAVADLGPDHRAAAAARRGRRADPLHGQPGAVRGGARAQAAADPARRAPPLAAARPGAAGRLAALHRRLRALGGLGRAGRCGRPRPWTSFEQVLAGLGDGVAELRVDLADRLAERAGHGSRWCRRRSLVTPWTSPRQAGRRRRRRPRRRGLPGRDRRRPGSTTTGAEPGLAATGGEGRRRAGGAAPRRGAAAALPGAGAAATAAAAGAASAAICSGPLSASAGRSSSTIRLSRSFSEALAGPALEGDDRADHHEQHQPRRDQHPGGAEAGDVCPGSAQAKMAPHGSVRQRAATSLALRGSASCGNAQARREAPSPRTPRGPRAARAGPRAPRPDAPALQAPRAPRALQAPRAARLGLLGLGLRSLRRRPPRRWSLRLGALVRGRLGLRPADVGGRAAGDGVRVPGKALRRAAAKGSARTVRATPGASGRGRPAAWERRAYLRGRRRALRLPVDGDGPDHERHRSAGAAARRGAVTGHEVCLAVLGGAEVDERGHVAGHPIAGRALGRAPEHFGALALAGLLAQRPAGVSGANR